jgi:hypothetical protein
MHEVWSGGSSFFWGHWFLFFLVSSFKFWFIFKLILIFFLFCLLLCYHVRMILIAIFGDLTRICWYFFFRFFLFIEFFFISSFYVWILGVNRNFFLNFFYDVELWILFFLIWNTITMLEYCFFAFQEIWPDPKQSTTTYLIVILITKERGWFINWVT